MDADFTIDVDPRRDLVAIHMAGFFTAADIDRFLAARAEAHAHLRCGPNEHLTINDLSAMKVQAQDMVAAFRDLLADPAYRSRRLAFVVGRNLARSQLVRALDGRDARCFYDRADAEAWLFAPARAAA